LHAAQAPVVASQVGETSEQRVVFVFEHCKQRPWRPTALWHAGAVASGHAPIAAEPKSPVQATHCPVCVLHAGAVVVHSASAPGPHWVHRPTKGPAVLHVGSAAKEQAAGVAAPKLPSQTLQTPSEHTGVAAGQFDDAFAEGRVGAR